MLKKQLATPPSLYHQSLIDDLIAKIKDLQPDQVGKNKYSSLGFKYSKSCNSTRLLGFNLYFQSSSEPILIECVDKKNGLTHCFFNFYRRPTIITNSKNNR